MGSPCRHRATKSRMGGINNSATMKDVAPGPRLTPSAVIPAPTPPGQRSERERECVCESTHTGSPGMNHHPCDSPIPRREHGLCFFDQQRIMRSDEGGRFHPNEVTVGYTRATTLCLRCF